MRITDAAGSARRFATGTPYGITAFCVGWTFAIVVQNIEVLDPSATAAAIFYGFAHPFARSSGGGSLLIEYPARGLLVPAGLIVVPLLLGGYLHARDVGPPRAGSIRGAAMRGGSIAGGYATIALVTSWAFELQSGVLITGGWSLDPGSTTLSAFVAALLLGGLGGILAEHVERRIVVAFASVPFAALLVLLYVVATW